MPVAAAPRLHGGEVGTVVLAGRVLRQEGGGLPRPGKFGRIGGHQAQVGVEGVAEAEAGLAGAEGAGVVEHVGMPTQEGVDGRAVDGGHMGGGVGGESHADDSAPAVSQHGRTGVAGRAVRCDPAATGLRARRSRMRAMTTAHVDHPTSFVVRHVDLPGGPVLEYVESGDPGGVPVVFLHGITDSWRSFEPVLPYLPPWIRAVSVTQRGHGASSRPASGYGLADFAGDVAGLLDRFGIERAVIAGHSMGSLVAARFAVDHPDRLAGLILAGSFHRPADNAAAVEYRDDVAAHLTDPIDRSVAVEFQESTLARPVPDAFLDMVVAESLKVPARVWRDAFAGILDNTHVDRLATVTAPTLILWGDRDAFGSQDDQLALGGLIAGSRLTIYAGAGHALHWEEPERFAGDVAAFVEGATVRR